MTPPSPLGHALNRQAGTLPYFEHTAYRVIVGDSSKSTQLPKYSLKRMPSARGGSVRADRTQ
jgi:hypothetical protein